MLTPAVARDASLGAVITPATVLGDRMRTFQAAVAPVSAAWPLANRAILIPFSIAEQQQVVEMFFQAGTLPGTANYDLGIYRDDFTRLVSLGATAAVNTTDATLPVGGGDTNDVLLTPGRYYMAMSAAATTVTARMWTYANSMPRAWGLLKMDTAHPLPTTITPASYSTDTLIPYIGLSTITNIL